MGEIFIRPTKEEGILGPREGGGVDKLIHVIEFDDWYYKPNQPLNQGQHL